MRELRDITVKGLAVAYGDRVVFDGFDAAFAGGKVSVVLGGSGVGKTTLLNAVAKLIPYGGEVNGADGDVSYIFQKDRLIPHLSVYKNLDLVLRAKISDKNERRKRIDEMLARLEILSERDKLPRGLSGGQAQRVALARAFLYPSEILLMDEPFRALDYALKLRLFEQFSALEKESPRTVIFVTHDIEECLLLADDYYVLGGSPARITLSGSADIPREERKAGDTAAGEVRAALYDALSDKGGEVSQIPADENA